MCEKDIQPYFKFCDQPGRRMLLDIGNIKTSDINFGEQHLNVKDKKLVFDNSVLGELDIETRERNINQPTNFEDPVDILQDVEFDLLHLSSLGFGDGFAVVTHNTDFTDLYVFVKNETWELDHSFVPENWDNEVGSTCSVYKNRMVVMNRYGEEVSEEFPFKLNLYEWQSGEFTLLTTFQSTTIRPGGVLFIIDDVISLIEWRSSEVRLHAFRFEDNELKEFNAPWNGTKLDNIGQFASNNARGQMFKFKDKIYLTYGLSKSDGSYVIPTYKVDNLSTELVDTVKREQFTNTERRRSTYFIDDQGDKPLLAHVYGALDDETKIFFYEFVKDKWEFINETSFDSNFGNAVSHSDPDLGLDPFRGRGNIHLAIIRNNKLLGVSTSGLRVFNIKRRHPVILEEIETLETDNEYLPYISQNIDGTELLVIDGDSGKNEKNKLTFYSSEKSSIETEKIRFSKEIFEADEFVTKKIEVLDSTPKSQTLSLYNQNGVLKWNGLDINTSVSDERIKKNIELSDKESDYKIFENINIFNYQYRNESEKRIVHGFIAQNIEEFLPSAVHDSYGVIPDFMTKVQVINGEIEIENDLRNGDYVKLDDDKFLVLMANKNKIIVNRKLNGEFLFYGRYVDDRKVIRKDRLLAILFNTVKHLDEKIKELEKKINYE